jgi:putative inorganic carbon (HCO3(-)) transporter
MVVKAKYLDGFLAIWWILFSWKWLRSGFAFGRFRPGEWAAITFIVLVWLSAILSEDFVSALYGNLFRAEGLLAIIAYVSLFFFASRYVPVHRYTAVMWAMSASSAIVSIYGVLQHFHLDSILRPLVAASGTRSFGFFNNPNFFGSYLVLFLAIAATLYLTSSNKIKILICLVVISIQFMALIYTETRSAWLGAIAMGGFLTMYIVLKQRNLLKRWLILLFTLAILFVGMNHFEHNSFSHRANSILGNVKQAVDGDDHAGANRWYIWRKTIPLIPVYFWHGSGPDSLARVFPINKEENKIYLGNENAVVDKAHNEYLQIAVTMGVPTLLAYLSLVGIVLWSGWSFCMRVENPSSLPVATIEMANSPQESSRRRLIQAGLLAAVIGYVIQAFFNISVIAVAPFYWMILGMCYGWSKDGATENPAS